MFGMLDYRAHKLYKVLVFPIIFVLTVLNIFCLPIIAYLIAINYASESVWQFLLAVVTLFLIGIPWFFIVKMILAIPEAIFNFLLDPEPADGRTKEEAKLVVVSGQKGITLLEFNKPASEWSDEAIEALSRISLTSRLFQNKIRKRFYALKDYYMNNPDLKPGEYNNIKFLKESNLAIGWLESIISNPFWRVLVLQGLTLLVLLIFYPHTAPH